MFDPVIMLQTSLRSRYPLRHSENMFTTLECVINKTCNDRLFEGELLSCTLFALLWFFLLGFPRKVFNEATREDIHETLMIMVSKGECYESQQHFRVRVDMEPISFKTHSNNCRNLFYIRNCIAIIL